MKTNKILMKNKVQRRKKSFGHYLSQIVNIRNNPILIKNVVLFLSQNKEKFKFG